MIEVEENRFWIIGKEKTITDKSFALFTSNPKRNLWVVSYLENFPNLFHGLSPCTHFHIQIIRPFSFVCSIFFSRVDICQDCRFFPFQKTRPSEIEVSPQTFGLSESILPIAHRIAGDHRIVGDHRIAYNFSYFSFPLSLPAEQKRIDLSKVIHMDEQKREMKL